jgi:cytochrome c5
MNEGHAMYRLARAVLLHFAALGALAAVLAGCASPTPAPTATPLILPTPTPKRMPAAVSDWLIVDVPANATQEQYGAEVYRLVCQDCHGDKGQGLTPEWRATWAPQDQNCWQSRCHAANHPPEGFILPIAPAIVGKSALAQFSTAADLHSFIQAQMPWYRPGSLVEKDAWAVTAHVLSMNGIDPGSQLDAHSAASIPLR